jgi:hypothetical protein
MEAKYDVELLQGGELVAKSTCDPLHPMGRKGRLCAVRFELGDEHHINCRLQCSLRVPKSGPTTVRSTLSFAGAPVGLRLARAELSVEQ